MKNLRSIFAGATLLAACVVFSSNVSAQAKKPAGKPWPAPAEAIAKKNPVKSDAASIKDGKEIYAQQCKSCHGAKGKGDGNKAEKIDISCGDFSSPETKKATDGELFWKTKEGRKPMPSSKEKLTDTNIWNVVNFLRSL